MSATPVWWVVAGVRLLLLRSVWSARRVLILPPTVLVRAVLPIARVVLAIDASNALLTTIYLLRWAVLHTVNILVRLANKIIVQSALVVCWDIDYHYLLRIYVNLMFSVILL